MTKNKNASIQADLFGQDEQHSLATVPQREQLAMLVELLLIEIAAALANREGGDDQDHD